MTVLEEPRVTPTHAGVGALQTHIPKAASRLPHVQCMHKPWLDVPCTAAQCLVRLLQSSGKGHYAFVDRWSKNKQEVLWPLPLFSLLPLTSSDSHTRE